MNENQNLSQAADEVKDSAIDLAHDVSAFIRAFKSWAVAKGHALIEDLGDDGEWNNSAGQVMQSVAMHNGINYVGTDAVSVETFQNHPELLNEIISQPIAGTPETGPEIQIQPEPLPAEETPNPEPEPTGFTAPVAPASPAELVYGDATTGTVQDNTDDAEEEDEEDGDESVAPAPEDDDADDEDAEDEEDGDFEEEEQIDNADEGSDDTEEFLAMLKAADEDEDEVKA